MQSGLLFILRIGIVQCGLVGSLSICDAQQGTPFDAITERLAESNGGYSTSKPDSNIILGSNVKSGAYNFQVSLLAAATPTGHEAEGHFCGGSLIDTTWVLTAAHCVTSNGAAVAPDLIDVYVASYNFTGGDRVPLKTVTRHPNFISEYFENDIAILQLAREPDPEVELSNRVGKIGIVTPSIEASLMKAGTPATILGWGATETSYFSRTLHAASIQIIDRAQCNTNIVQKRSQDLRDELSQIARSFRIESSRLKDVQDVILQNAGPLVSDNMFCAGDPALPINTRVADACQGDSGGPIFVTGPAGKYIQVGIISWGEGCGVPKLYGVYTRLARYANWILETIRAPRMAAP
jgi:secreted trypsin-like serine protease